MCRCVCMYEHVRAMVCMWRPEDNWGVPSLQLGGSRVKLVGKHLYLLSHLSGPQTPSKRRENLPRDTWLLSHSAHANMTPTR